MSRSSKIKRKQLQTKLYKKGLWDKTIKLNEIYIKYYGKCQSCEILCDFEDYKNHNNNKVIGNSYPTIDHIIPLSKGGRHSWENVQLLCNKCNIKKGDKINE